jgi:hypothetical protein
MEKWKWLWEEGLIFFAGSVFSAMKTLLGEEGEIDWFRILFKTISNVIAGIALYSFLIAYKPWYSEYPQKTGIIIVLVYAGSRGVDLVAEKVIKWIEKQLES